MKAVVKEIGSYCIYVLLIYDSVVFVLKMPLIKSLVELGKDIEEYYVQYLLS